MWCARITGHHNVELWTSCDFGCRYCVQTIRRWAATYQEPSKLPEGGPLFDLVVRPRRLDRLPFYRSGDKVMFSLCFDPYPIKEKTAQVTRRAIATLHQRGIGVMVTTKSGWAAVRDFQEGPGAEVPPGHPAFGSHEDDTLVATLTFLDEADSRKWEPRAAVPAERMAALEEAHRRGIPTAANLAPVLDTDQALELIRRTAGYTDFYKMHPLIQSGPVSDDEYAAFAQRAELLCRGLGVPCYACEDVPHRDVDYEAVDDLISLGGWKTLCKNEAGVVNPRALLRALP
jgi:hypothetical protein